MDIPSSMTMRELRDFANENGVFYSHVYGSNNGKVAIYKDRYRYRRIGFTIVTDYKPIKNYRMMASGRTHNKQVLDILRKHAKAVPMAPGEEKQPDIIITIMPEADEEYEIIKQWMEENG